MFTATVLPLATAFIICEAFGLEAAVDRRWREAPFFYSLFAGGIVLGAGLVLLLPANQLFQYTFYAQVMQGAVLPLELVLMLIIINRKRVMGKYVNSRTVNIIAWATAIVIGGLAIVFVVQSLLGGSSNPQRCARSPGASSIDATSAFFFASSGKIESP